MPVQLLNTHWDQDIVETRVTVSLDRLNDLLRMLTETSNRHEEAIDALQTKLQETTDRTSKLEQDFDNMKPDGEKAKAVDTAIDQLTIQLERLRRDFDTRLETALKQNRQQHQGFDEGISNLKDELLRQDVFFKEANNKSREMISDCRERLDAIKIPDVTPLHQGLDEIKSWKKDANERLVHCARFVRLWGVTRENLEKLCGGRNASIGIGGDVEPSTMVSTPTTQLGSRSGSASPNAQNVASNSGSPSQISPGRRRSSAANVDFSGSLAAGSKVSGDPGGAPPGVAGTGGLEVERTEYLHSLPAFDTIWRHYNKVEKKTTEYIDYKNQVLGNKLIEKVGKHEIAELANELKEQHSQVRQTVDFLERRLQENDALESRLVKAEERIRYMHHNKADAQALDLKADVGIVQQISGEVVEVREDLQDVFARLAAMGSHAGRRNTDADVMGRSASILAGSNVDPRRMSVSALNTPGVGIPSPGSFSQSPSASINNKRFTDFAEMIASLERRKADRSELQPLQEYVEKLEGKVAALHGAVTGVTPEVGGVISKVNSAGPSPTSAAAGGGSAGSLPPVMTPTKPGTARPESAGDAATAGDAAAAGTIPRGRGRSPKRPGTGGSAASSGTGGGVGSRLGSAGSPRGRSRSRSPLSKLGLMEGHGLPPVEDGDARVRPFLGRGLVGVRDAAGSSIPATIGYHRPQYIFKGVDGEALVPPPAE